MCIGGSGKQPKVPDPVSTPVITPEPTPPPPVIDENSPNGSNQKKAKGSASLVIPLNNVGISGLNIPTG